MEKFAGCVKSATFHFIQDIREVAMGMSFVAKVMALYMTVRGTGMLDGLAGSHTRLVIYPTLAICYQRVVIHALLNTRFKGEVGSDLPGYHQTTKVTLTEGSPESSWYMHMDKQVTHSILDMLFSMRGTKTAEVESLWLINRPECFVPEYPDNSLEV